MSSLCDNCLKRAKVLNILVFGFYNWFSYNPGAQLTLKHPINRGLLNEKQRDTIQVHSKALFEALHRCHGAQILVTFVTLTSPKGVSRSRLSSSAGTPKSESIFSVFRVNNMFGPSFYLQIHNSAGYAYTLSLCHPLKLTRSLVVSYALHSRKPHDQTISKHFCSLSTQLCFSHQLCVSPIQCSSFSTWLFRTYFIDTSFP